MIIPNEIFKLNAILKAFRSDIEIRLVGGFLRDSILGLNPSEVDLATNLQPEDLIEILKKAGVKCLATGLSHGTVTAIIEDQAFEITSLRKDLACDGRKAQVSFTDSWEEDAARRDFTINALYLDLNNTLYDYFDGQKDLQLNQVKFIGNPEKRIEEDYLRLLRYFRFLAYFKTNEIDQPSLEAAIGLKLGLQKLSIERIQKELFKLLSLPYPDKSLQLIIENNLLDCLWSNKIHYFESLSFSANPFVNLAAIFYINRVSLDLCRFKLSKAQLAKINFLLQFNHNHLKDLLDCDSQNKSIIQFKAEFGMEKTLMIFDFAKVIYLKEMGLNDQSLVAKFLDKINNLPEKNFPLKGEDLIKIGYKGSAISQKLKAGRKIWLESECNLGLSDLLKLLKNNNF
jgi:poly(A) polymerase